MPASPVAGTLGPHAASAVLTGSVSLPKRNYGFEKRQKELNKQRKREEKLVRKLDRANAAADDAAAAESPSPAPPRDDDGQDPSRL